MTFEEATKKEKKAAQAFVEEQKEAGQGVEEVNKL